MTGGSPLTSHATWLSLLLVVATIAGPVVAQPEDAYDDKLSPAAAEIDGLVGFSVPADVVTYDGRPGYFVTYEAGEFSSLDAWINESDSRELVHHDNDSRRVLLSADPIEVHGGFGLASTGVSGVSFPRPTFSSGLVDNSYVESIDVNLEIELVDPVTSLDNESEFETPAPNLLVSGRWSSEGVAFAEDANDTDMDEVRDLVGADDVPETGDGINISVIDTGANVGDGEIFGNGTSGSTVRITAAKNFISNETVNTSESDPDWSVVEDGNGHGSWVAAAAAANVSGTTHDGVAPNANLTIAKALGDDGSGDTQDIARAIDWSEENGADVVIMSLGSPIYSAVLADELDEAINDGGVTVAVIAAGNSRETVRYVGSPADAPVDGVVAVAATNAPSNVTSARSAYFSNVGPDPARDLSNGVTLGASPDVAAPGMQVVAPTLASTDGIRRNVSLSGTSMATPIVGGAYAVALERRAEWRNDSAELERWTADTAQRMPEAGTTEVGAGMIAVDDLAGRSPAGESQSRARNDDAVARDQANEAFGASTLVRFVGGIGQGVSPSAGL